MNTTTDSTTDSLRILFPVTATVNGIEGLLEFVTAQLVRETNDTVLAAADTPFDVFDVIGILHTPDDKGKFLDAMRRINAWGREYHREIVLYDNGECVPGQHGASHLFSDVDVEIRFWPTEADYTAAFEHANGLPEWPPHPKPSADFTTVVSIQGGRPKIVRLAAPCAWIYTSFKEFLAQITPRVTKARATGAEDMGAAAPHDDFDIIGSASDFLADEDGDLAHRLEAWGLATDRAVYVEENGLRVLTIRGAHFSGRYTLFSFWSTQEARLAHRGREAA
jgi:hypothetical protein